VTAALGGKAATKDIYVKQGSDWGPYQFTLTDSNGDTVNLTGSDSFAGKVRATEISSTVLATFTFSVNTTTDTVSVSMSATTSAAMTAVERITRLRYDFEWTKASGVIDRIMQGNFILSAEVTR